MQMLRMARPRRQKFFIDGRRRYGGKSKVFRSTDDPNDVLLLQDVADVSKARTWYGSSEMKSLMEKSGVVGSPSIRSAA